MSSLMMDFPLTLPHLLERAGLLFPRQEIASRTADGFHRYTYADFHRRVHKLAHVLASLGVQRGDRVATLSWNSHQHLELYFAVPCCGAVLHTLNARLAHDQIAFLINHAWDRVIFVDESLRPLLDSLAGQLPGVRHIITIPDEYESLLAGAPGELYKWPELGELEPASTCYTSGTTGNPKGVLYTHRAIVLHTFALAMVDSFGIRHSDTVLQAVPMFHVNGWGIPYVSVMTGAKIVFSGRHLPPEEIAGLIQQERVTFTAGVPTIWLGVYTLLQRQRYDLSSLRMVVCAGSAMPRQLLEAFATQFGVPFVLAWGMTETTPIATLQLLKDHLRSLPDTDRFEVMARHGSSLPGVEVRIVDEQGVGLPWDGATMGELQVRGLWVTSGYVQDPRGDWRRNQESFQDGWFRTGDVATIDREGYIQIMDRTKDLVKSGGEWISSVDLENLLMGHPQIQEAAVIAVEHPKWVERPLACVVPHEEFKGSLTKEEILQFLAPKVAIWWLPDDVVFIEAVPKTSVGKFNKRALRERFHGHLLAQKVEPEAAHSDAPSLPPSE